MTPTATQPPPTATPTPIPTYEPYRLPFFDDFEEILPWETVPVYDECLWHLDTVRYYSEYHAWAYNRGEPFFDYNTGARNSCSLVSPLISLANTVHPELRYMDWIQVEERVNYDICWTEISVDNGQNWTTLLEVFGSTEEWIARGPIDLTPFVGRIVRIRFRFDTLDSQFNNYEGWYIDDVLLQEAPTPTPTASATAYVPTATPTQTGRHGLELFLNDDMFFQGMDFHLEMALTNTTATNIPVDVYIVLDVYGSYWFWPSWSTTVDSRPDVLIAGESNRETLLLFEWPQYNGSFDDIVIWGATLAADSSDVIGDVDNVSFGCNL